MNERRGLLESIANTIRDYRAGDLPEPTPEHVDKWIRQFGADAQLSLLREMDHVLRHAYFSESRVRRFVESVIEDREFTGGEPREFWRAAHLLDIQQDGHSQSEIRKLFSDAIDRKYGVVAGTAVAGNGVFVYLDDVLFSGSRAGNDLTKWIDKHPLSTATVHIVVIAAHRLGWWQCDKRLGERARKAGKEFRFTFWAAQQVENRLKYRDDSEVLWPTEIPADAALGGYIAQEERFRFTPRRPGGNVKWPVFSSEAGRQLLERELLLAGMRIRSFCQKPSPAMRPLGFSSFNVGFGSMIITYRNCPNNAPLALWWGDPEANPAHPLSRWYPLVQRKPYTDAEVENHGFPPF